MKQKAHPRDQWRYMTNKTSPKGKAAVLKWHHQSIRHSHLSPKSNHGKLWGKKSCYPFTYASAGNIMFLSLLSPLLILSTDRPDSGTSKVSICQVKQMMHLAWKGVGDRKSTEKCTPMATAQHRVIFLIDVKLILLTVHRMSQLAAAVSQHEQYWNHVKWMERSHF